MRSMTLCLASVSLWLLALPPSAVSAHPDPTPSLPPGPIRDRHELMESMRKQAESIEQVTNAAGDAPDTAVIQRAAQAISMSAARIPNLFPKGSTDPMSRALPAIWDDAEKFQQLAKDLQQQATALSNAAAAGSKSVAEKSRTLSATCKSCHDQFRRPEKERADGS